MQIPPKKEDEKKPTVKEEEEAEEKPTAQKRLTEAVREAKLKLLKVSALLVSQTIVHRIARCACKGLALSVPAAKLP